mgnify:CR=1 FL=1
MKKIPTRTCIGCGEQKPKNELIRIVKNQTGEIKVDKIGKLSGRGAYICDNSECLEKAIKSKRFEKEFETNISDEIYSSLRRDILSDK